MASTPQQVTDIGLAQLRVLSDHNRRIDSLGILAATFGGETPGFLLFHLGYNNAWATIMRETCETLLEFQLRLRTGTPILLDFYKKKRDLGE